jgi:hypothetical protein
VINGTNMLAKDNPRWPAGNGKETTTVPGLSSAVGLVIAWLAGLRRRAGRRLYAMNDLEASWRGWQVIETSGGLGRQYRDARFDSLAARRDTWTNAADADGPAPRSSRPPVPEAWDDHWNGPLDGDG